MPYVRGLLVALLLLTAGCGGDDEYAGPKPPRFRVALNPERLRMAPRPFVLSGGREVRAEQSTYCWSGPNSDVCADYAEELPTGRTLVVRSGTDIWVDMRVPATELAAHARRRLSIRSSAVRLAVVKGPSARVWRVRVPDQDLRTLELEARYPQGDGYFSLPIQVRLR